MQNSKHAANNRMPGAATSTCSTAVANGMMDNLTIDYSILSDKFL